MVPRTNSVGETFGKWMLVQRDVSGAMADLIAAAKADRAFPRRGSPEAVRKRLIEMQADGDMHALIDDAQTDWLSCCSIAKGANTA